MLISQINFVCNFMHLFEIMYFKKAGNAFPSFCSSFVWSGWGKRSHPNSFLEKHVVTKHKLETGLIIMSSGQRVAKRVRSLTRQCTCWGQSLAMDWWKEFLCVLTLNVCVITMCKSVDSFQEELEWTEHDVHKYWTSLTTQLISVFHFSWSWLSFPCVLCPPGCGVSLIEAVAAAHGWCVDDSHMSSTEESISSSTLHANKGRLSAVFFCHQQHVWVKEVMVPQVLQLNEMQPCWEKKLPHCPRYPPSKYIQAAYTRPLLILPPCSSRPNPAHVYSSAT